MVMFLRTLLIDADDTLWGDGEFFQKAYSDFLRILDEIGVTKSEAIEFFEQANEKRRMVTGYGAYAFADAMIDTLKEFVPLCENETLNKITTIGQRLIEHPVICHDGVEKTLSVIGRTSQLIMVTQGDPRYQSRKIYDSGIADYFTAIEIVPSKNKQAYCSLVTKYSLDKATTWMIGNSPACDISPALEAGLKAIYIPNKYTWDIDKVPINGTYKELSSFRELITYFHDHI